MLFIINNLIKYYYIICIWHRASKFFGAALLILVIKYIGV